MRFADVAKNGALLRAAGLGFALAEPHHLAHAPIARDVGAGFLAHQIGQPTRQFAFLGVGKLRAQHVRHCETQHAVAEKLQPLIGFARAAAPVLAPRR